MTFRPEQADRPPITSPLVGQGLCVGYDDRIILDNVEFELAAGQLTVLLGPNGCGKSTLLKALARTLPTRQGTVLLDGQDIQAQPAKAVARRLGVLPQSPTAPEGMTVRELVALGRFPYQSLLRQWSKADQAAVEKAMANADVSQFADRPVEALSGGQRQRCWIAMVLAQETELLLLDEPTTFLDLKVQVDLLELLKDLCTHHQRTLLVVLHDLNLAAAYADQLVMMRDGRIRYRGSPQAVFTERSLKEVFDLDAQVLADPQHGAPVCLPLKRGADTPFTDRFAREQVVS